MRSGFLRPEASEIGPANKLPNAKPTIKSEIVNCAFDAVVSKSFLILGKPGKNISIDKGPIAVSAPKMTINSIDL